MPFTDVARPDVCLFVDDTKDGVIVVCGVCKQETEDKSPVGKCGCCTYCGNELVYPTWCDW